MASMDSIRDDEAHMEVLSNIGKLNEQGIKPDLHLLRERVKVVKSHMDLIVSDLFKKKCIDSDSAVRDFVITEHGRNTLDNYREYAKRFASSMLGLFQSDRKEELYELIMNHKDLLWFAYYERLLTKEEIKKVAKSLGVSTARIWWDKSIQNWGSIYER